MMMPVCACVGCSILQPRRLFACACLDSRDTWRDALNGLLSSLIGKVEERLLQRWKLVPRVMVVCCGMAIAASTAVGDLPLSTDCPRRRYGLADDAGWMATAALLLAGLPRETRIIQHDCVEVCACICLPTRSSCLNFSQPSKLEVRPKEVSRRFDTSG